MSDVPLFHCDRPEHGYGCFHLDEDLGNLTPEEQDEFREYQEDYYIDYETVEEVDTELTKAESAVQYAYDEYMEKEEDVEVLKCYRVLLIKKNTPKPHYEPRDFKTIPLPLTDVV